MRALLVALVLAFAGDAIAQEEGEGVSGKGEVRGIGAEVRAISGEVYGIAGPIVNLGGEVVGLQVKESKTEIRLELAADVLFDFDKASLKPAAQETLKKAGAFIRENAKTAPVAIEGHTDGKGADSYNQKLSEQRVQSVRDYFVKTEKLSGVTFSTKGYGKTKPVAPNAKPDGSDDPEGRQKNRRVEIIIRKNR